MLLLEILEAYSLEVVEDFVPQAIVLARLQVASGLDRFQECSDLLEEH
jgi:hypothetical protein